MTHKDEPDENYQPSAEASRLQRKLDKYHRDEKIHPDNFKSDDENKKCPNLACCERVTAPETLKFPSEVPAISNAYADRSYLGSYIPRIVVISLSRPKRDKEPTGGSLNPHWKETLGMIRSLLKPFLKEKLPGLSSRFEESHTKEVGKLFVHLRTAKCCSRKGDEPLGLYRQCGSYLGSELNLLKPDVVVTQGEPAHGELKLVADFWKMERLSRFNFWKVKGSRFLWLPQPHPRYAGGLSEIGGEREESGTGTFRRKEFVRDGNLLKRYFDLQ